jgi:hypothetical protein
VLAADHVADFLQQGGWSHRQSVAPEGPRWCIARGG